MANFRRGAEAIQAAASRSGGGKFTPTHKFEAGETKYLQFLTSIDEIPTVLMHRFITVGFREDGSPKYADFISRRDSALDGPEGYDELIDRFGSNPSQRCIAIAVELEPIYKKNGTKKVLEGFDVAYREYTDSEGNEKSVPNVALVIESPFTLFTHVTNFADIKPIEDVVFAVKRNGKGTDTSYTLIEAGEALDLEDDEEIGAFFEEFDFDAYLDNLADEDRMRELIAPLDDDFVVNKWAKKGKGGKNSSKKDEEEDEKPSRSRSTRTRRAPKPEPVDEGDEEADDAEPEAADEAPTRGARKRKFSDLRKELAG